jgi:hypothetical protein
MRIANPFTIYSRGSIGAIVRPSLAAVNDNPTGLPNDGVSSDLMTDVDTVTGDKVHCLRGRFVVKSMS